MDKSTVMRSHWAAGAAIALVLLAGCQDVKPPTPPSGPTASPSRTTGQYVAPAMPFKEGPHGPAGHLLPPAEVTRIYWSGDGKWLVTTSRDGEVTIWDPTKERPTPPAKLGRHSFKGTMGRYVAVQGDTLVEDTAGKLTVRKISTGEALRPLEQSEHARTDSPYFLSGDGKRLVVLDVPRQEFDIWDIATGRLIHAKTPKTERFVHQMVGVSRDGKEAYGIITGIQSGRAFRSEPIKGIHAISLETGAVELRVRHALSFTGSFFFPRTADDRIFFDDRAWDLKTGKEVGRYPWPQTDLAQYPWQQVQAVEPSGHRVAFFEQETGSQLRVVIWDVQAKARVGRLPRLAADIGPMAFSPDGRYLAVGGRRDWKSDRLPPERRQEPPPPFTPPLPPFPGAQALHIEDRVLLLYDVKTLKRVRTLAFPVYPVDSKEVPDPEIP